MILQNQNNQEEIIKEEQEVKVEVPKKKRASKSKTQKEATKDEAVKDEVIVDEVGEFDLTAYIEQWKKEHKRVFKNDIDGETIIWRRLKRGEYKEILSLEEEDQDSSILIKQERMTKATILYPFDVDALIEENAGLATVLSEEILAKSGFAMSYTEEL